jgi:hypothetical protein
MSYTVADGPEVGDGGVGDGDGEGWVVVFEVCGAPTLGVAQLTRMKDKPAIQAIQINRINRAPLRREFSCCA